MNSNNSASLRVFVTGATGVVGRRVVPLLLRDGHRVTVLARSADQHARFAKQGIASYETTMFNRDALVRALDGQQVVINLASHMPSSSFRMMFRSAWRENDRVRREGSANILHAAHTAGIDTYIQESFAPVYEDGGRNWINEHHPLRPVAYNATVLDAEASANEFTAADKRGIVVRFGGLYGPDAFHVRELVRMVRMGWASLPGSADAYWSSISHDDAATAVVAAINAPAGTYNVVDDQPLTRSEFFNALADAFALTHPRMLPAWTMKLMGSAGELLGRSQRIANQKLRAATGWAPSMPSAREGFRAIATEWAACTGVRCPQRFVGHGSPNT
ncbi:MAG: NAD(P)-dependent oxidoreductase [Gemmatimonas sp.]